MKENFFRNMTFVPQVINKTITPDFGTSAFTAGDVLFTPMLIGEVERQTRMELHALRIVWGIASPPAFSILFLSGTANPPSIGSANATPTITKATITNNLLGLVSVTDEDYVSVGTNSLAVIYGDISSITPGAVQNTQTGRLYVYMAGVIPAAHTALTSGNLSISTQIGVREYKVGI